MRFVALLLTAGLLTSSAASAQDLLPNSTPASSPAATPIAPAVTTEAPSVTAPGAFSYIIQQDLLCESSADCTVVETACPGWMGINKNFEAQAIQRTAAIKPYIECASSAEARSKPEAECVDKICQIQK